MSIFTTQKYYEDHEKLVEKSWSVPHFTMATAANAGKAAVKVQ